MRNAILLFMLICIMACESDVKKDHKLSDEQLTSLMLDLHIAEAVLPEFDKLHQDSISDLYWDKMTLVYGLSEMELRKEIELLESDAEKFKTILDQVKIMADSIK